MKTIALVIGICALMTCPMLTITGSASTPQVNLPTGDVEVRMNATYVYDTGWFSMKVTIPQGYSVINGTYTGWCVELDKNMTRGVNHQVRLYSSYDPKMPINFTSDNWDKVNYLINNKQGGNRSVIQEVIWYYICGGHAKDPKEKEIINYTDLHGAGFVPSYGNKIAILAEVIKPNSSVQRTFFELQLPYLVPLGLVWNDYNANGIQDSGEPGLKGITVSIYEPNGTAPVDSNPTDEQGKYSLSFPKGEYYLKFTLPSSYRFSPANRGVDETKDSDVNPDTGRTIISSFDPNDYNTSWDAGMYKVTDQGTPVEPPTPGNYAPTADGTAGEPYDGEIGEILHFNGSNSYDRDGTIVSWLWSFGDGTTANGIIVTHAYTTEGAYQVYLTVTDNDGATDKYQTIAHIGANRPPLKPTVTGPTEGKRNITYVFNMVTTDPDYDDVRYIIQWGDNSQNNSPFVRSGNSVQTMHQWTTWGFYTVQVSAQDFKNLTSEMYKTVIAIDVRYVGNLGYLINTDSTASYDTFYSNSTKKQNSVQQQGNGIYLIDTNNDGSFDYQYNPSTNTYQKNNPGILGSIYPILIVGVIVAILLLLLLWFLARRKKNKT